MRKDISPPSVLFEQPMCVEVMGAGFQKIPMSRVS
jgi:DNA ligase-4